MIVILENIRPGSVNVGAVDARLRQRFPTLTGWSYCFSDDTLTLEFPDADIETAIENKISDALSKVKQDYSGTRLRQVLLKRDAVTWVI